jgi:hypothetical protein
MKVEILPTCTIEARYGSAADAPKTAHLHVALWLSVELEAWGERREGHLHLIREVGGGSWRPIDVSRHPMGAAAGDHPPIDVDGTIAALRDELDERGMSFYRVPELGVVSEMGETGPAFRRRVLGVLRPTIQQRIDGPAGEGSDASDLAAQLSRLVGSIEEHRCNDVWSHVKRVAVGVLYIPDGLDLRNRE